MKCCLSDLRYKEVIDLTTGQRLGYVCDAEIDLEQGKIVSLIVPGQKKLGGLLSGDDDYILPWESISRLGKQHFMVIPPQRFGTSLWRRAAVYEGKMFLRILPSAFFSRRDTCAWLMPISPATSIWVLPA